MSTVKKVERERLEKVGYPEPTILMLELLERIAKAVEAK